MTSRHLDPLRQAIRQQPVSPAPAPWKLTGQFTVAGLLEIGFDRDSERLLVASSSGRSVIDCRTGEKIARDRTDNLGSDHYLETRGIGPLHDRVIRMAGIQGGSLPISTSDGWVVENITLAWPEQHLLLVEPGSWLHGARYNRPWQFHTLAIETEVRAFGFSYTGLSLVIATGGELLIYGRAASHRG
ncbi:hypothetical protein ABE525_24090 [Pseudomonas wadenswilerensis]|jgi:hypothetical protein|uniref:Uncharacterized protein n=1 Tax=Pseudomonas wadenswilerensis TaxID=1785161 RepID=A0A380T2R8_9PSED|nr:hypothetical protein [Pseudomonas]MCE5983692.1 hypothetical protein [Pseudomonas sp. LF19]UVM23959.1 hypothetical protein LOY45_10505 [Pseudomonas wadenswilerensis]SPO66331.1 conserved protein of unknown function [Pseudomonas sp. JV241A]SUQ63816.1 hypothetical protein CCOS864_03270 [Pseudomonas wadenswilerensis]